MQNTTYCKKFIESEAMPLEAINKECVREKSIRHGHPSTLHLWWARRPLAAARAVIFSSIVDDPFCRPDLFTTPEEAMQESNRLAGIVSRLVVWENSGNHEVLKEAMDAIKMYAAMKGKDGKEEVQLPSLFDPFAGGGAIPLEGARLGLTSYAGDLNPVAVLINKAMIEIPPKYAGMKAVNPKADPNLPMEQYAGTAALASDVEYYGKWIKDKARGKLRSMYPKVKGKDGGEHTVIAWLWTRTVRCPNPKCACEAPLAGSFVLSKKAGHEAYVKAQYIPISSLRGSEAASPSLRGSEATEAISEQEEIASQATQGGKIAMTMQGEEIASQATQVGKIAMTDAAGGWKLVFTVCHGAGEVQQAKTGKGQFKCIKCGEAIKGDYIKAQFTSRQNGARLMAIVAEGEHSNEYITPTKEQEKTAQVARREDAPSARMAGKARDQLPLYGYEDFNSLFTNRQLEALCTFSDLVRDAREQVVKDIQQGQLNRRFSKTSDAEEYADAVATYLAFLVDKLAMYNNSFCTWHTLRGKITMIFGRQAIPMTWDYVEANPFSGSTGSWDSAIKYVTKCIAALPANIQGFAFQQDASKEDGGIKDVMVSFDPPYYDNIAYADLSDFFYVWLRRSLGGIYPSLFATMATPKAPELIASPYRFKGGKKEASEFYEKGMSKVFERIRGIEHIKYPMTVYYAYRQSSTDASGTASRGWETLLSSIIQAGFIITGTLPLRTELTTNLKADKNALASSVVIVCRPRPVEAVPMQWGQFICALQEKMESAVLKMTQSKMSPVDMAQAAIGHGMEVYSAASAVVRAEGGKVSVRDALKEINRALDAALQRGSSVMDSESRVCFDVWEKQQWSNARYGEVDTLARAKNTSVQAVCACGAASSERGKFCLTARDEIIQAVSKDIHSQRHQAGSERLHRLCAWRNAGRRAAKCVWLASQTLAAAMTLGEYSGAYPDAAAAALGCGAETAERAKTLCYTLYQLSVKKADATEARAYNILVSSWQSITDEMTRIKDGIKEQGVFEIGNRE